MRCKSFFHLVKVRIKTSNKHLQKTAFSPLWSLSLFWKDFAFMTLGIQSEMICARGLLLSVYITIS